MQVFKGLKSGFGFKGTESSFKTKFILPKDYYKLIYFQTIWILFQLLPPTFNKYHFVYIKTIFSNNVLLVSAQTDQINSKTRDIQA